MYWLFDLLVPRFVHDRVALLEQENYYIPICQVSQLTELDKPTHVCTISGFQLFGFVLFPKQSEVVPFVWSEEEKYIK